MRSPVKRIPSADGILDIYEEINDGGGCELYGISRWRHPTSGQTFFHYVPRAILSDRWWDFPDKEGRNDDEGLV